MLTLALVLVLVADALPQISQTYTANGTFTVPVGVTQVTVECWGGGGRGGTRTTNGGGAGGGGGAYARSVLTVIPGNSYTVTRGTGSSGTGAGGDSWFGSIATILAKGGNSVANNGIAGATGGSFAASIGDVRYAGGEGFDGGNTSGNNGGGGGSSAGTGAIGTDATSSTGATAPTGGGNGGNGRTGTQNDGSDGTIPGGGGGGGKRTSSGTRDGGNGANGQVIVSFNPNGACMAAVTYNALPDNGCGSSNNLVVPVAISGLPTTLGTAAGNARLISVEVIVSHTYNRDIHISLTSPSGVTRNLILDRFGNGDNLGNPAACPGGALVFQDGGTALNTTNTSNVTGTFAPEQTLAGFTGNPNGNWTFTICDNEAADTGNLRYLKLNFCNVPQITAATSNSPICAGGSLSLSATATGTAPLTYAWTGTGTYSPNAASATPTVTGAASGNYNVTVSNGCGSTNTDVAVTVTTPPSATISYGGLPFCQGAGTASVTRTGTAGGSYSALPAGLTINSGSGLVTLGTSTTGSYTVTYTVAAAGGCALFATTAGITVNATPIRYQDLDGDGFGDPGSSITSCTPVAGYVSNNTDNCPTLFGLIGDACNDANANTINDLINGSCVCAGTNAPWYSQSSGTFTDPIWSHNIGGPGAGATINAGSIVVVQPGHTVTLAGSQAVNDLTVASTASLDLGSHTLTASGSSIQINGNLSGGTGTMVLQPTSSATLSGSGMIDFNNLSINASTGVTCSANAGIRGTLLLSNGVFTASGAVSLVSNASGTGRLGPVAATASYSGNLVVNRFIPAGATNWRILGSPVSGQTVNELKDDFYTAGFPGSHYPNFFSPINSGIFWPSIRWYDETNAGAAVINGLTGATSNTQQMAIGQGFAAWSGSTFATTTAFTVDMVGVPNVANSPIALPVSYTSTGVPATDGWNMVSNPLASPIAFNQISRGADVEDFITYFDPATGNNATWDISMGAGTNGGTNTIQSSQGFWLKATGSGVTTTVSESAKVGDNTGGFFGGDQEQIANIVRLRISSAINQYSDETLVVFSEGAPETNGDDVPKFVFAHPEAPQIATMGDAGQMIAINAYGPYTIDISIPVMVDVAVNGDYTITANGLDLIGLSCVRLEDLALNVSTPLVEGASYTFTALANDDPTVVRFMLHASAPLQFNTTSASCAGRDDGAASVVVGSGPVDILWIDAEGTVLLEQNGVQTGPSGIVALEAGDYSINITSAAGCGNLVQAFQIDEPAELEVDADAMPTSCPDSEDGTIELMAFGGSGPYTYLWSNGSTDSAVEVAAGTYNVVVTDANGCTIAPQEYLVSAGEGPEATISVESVSVTVGEEVAFFVATGTGVTNSWDFGDGATSNELEPTHAFDTPGNYTITLTVDDGTCTSIAELELSVETTTGLPTIVGQTLNAWVSGNVIVVDHNFNDNQPVLVRVLSTNGQLAQEHRFAGQPARLTLPTAELATGIWLVRVSSGPSARTFSLPVVH